MGVISMGGLGLAMKNESEQVTDDKMDTDRSNDSATSVAKPLMRLQKYFSDERWHELADQFNRELFRLYQVFLFYVFFLKNKPFYRRFFCQNYTNF